MNEHFTGSFTQQEPIPDTAIDAAVAVLKSGRLPAITRGLTRPVKWHC